MKKIFFILIACLVSVGVMADSKMSFVVSGDEDSYNMIKVINETSMEEISCRVVIIEEDDRVADVYGHYHLKGRSDSDTSTRRIQRGTKVGIQMPNDFEGEVAFDVEYKDYPIWDMIVIRLHDAKAAFDDKL